MKITMLDRNIGRRIITLMGMIVTSVIVLAFSLPVFLIPASASPASAAPLCGDGSAPDYGLSFDLQQEHWTVNWQNYVSEQTVTEVDTILDRLNGDSIAQTMILFQPQDQVGNRVNCAVHFLRYMKLGLSSGERKDNGFVFLIVVQPTSIDVHYGVGLGLPALTAPELTNLNRDTEDAYQTNQSMDKALLTLVHEFDTVARNKYAPLVFPSATPEAASLPVVPAGPQGYLQLCGLLCLGIVFLAFLIWAFSQLARGGISFGSPGSGSWGSGSSLGGGYKDGGEGSGPSMRGGGGSGRSGRGN